MQGLEFVLRLRVKKHRVMQTMYATVSMSQKRVNIRTNIFQYSCYVSENMF